MNDDEYIEEAELLIEAARYAVRQRLSRSRFLRKAKETWLRAAIETGQDPYVLLETFKQEHAEDKRKRQTNDIHRA